MRLISAIICILLLAAFGTPCGNAEEAAEKILKEGILGAAVGAAASEWGEGKAGKGALIGAGVNIVGGLLLDSITGAPVGTVGEVERMGSTEAYRQGYQQGYQQGFQQGFKDAYQKGYESGLSASE